MSTATTTGTELLDAYRNGRARRFWTDLRGEYGLTLSVKI